MLIWMYGAIQAKLGAQQSAGGIGESRFKSDLTEHPSVLVSILFGPG